MYHDETDITIKGRGLNIAFTRTYNSGYVALAAAGEPLSPGWTHSYNMRIPGQIARLHQIADPYGNELNFTYDGSGRLSGIADNLGIAGRSGLTLAYDSNRKLQSVSDWTGRTWTYGFTNDRLTSMTNPLNQTTTYVYAEGDDFLTGIVKLEDRDGQKVSTTFSYYENARAFTNRNTLAEGETVDYDLYRKSTRITDAGGFIRTHYYDKNGALTRLAEPDGGLMLFSNNEEGLRFQKTDSLGFVSQYSYRVDKSISNLPSNNFGRVSKEIDPLGNATEIDYGIFDQPTQTVDKRGTVFTSTYYASTNIPDGAIQGKLQRQQVVLDGSTVTLAEFTYTAGGNVATNTEFIDPADLSKKRVTTFTYDADGYNQTQIVVVGQPTGETVTTTFTYDALGRQLTQTVQRQTSAIDPTPLAITTSSAYDDLDRVIATTDPLGNIGRVVYDDNGQVTSESVDYFDGNTFTTRVMRSLTYEAADRVASETDIDGNVTQFSYDPRGNLIQVIDANNHIAKFEYDNMNRSTAVIDANGARAETIYDLDGRVVQITDANGNTTAFEYDKLGRQTKTTTALGLVTQVTYDANGNLLTTTDPEGRVSTHVYDTLNRRIRSTSAENGVTKFTYDLLGNRTSITGAENCVTTYIYDGLQRMVEVIDPLVQSPDKTVVMTVDELGNVLTRTDRNGETTRYTYDIANRLVKSEFLDDGTGETMAYDFVTDLVQLKNADVTYSYTYTASIA